MINGRTVWWAKDSGWWRRERIVELGEVFGPVGPAVIDWLACEAKAQNVAGVVKTGYRAIARGVFADVSTVRPVVSRSVELGLLDDFAEADRVFTCRISGWSAEQARARETVKKAGQRAARPHDPPANPPISDDGSDGTPPPRPGSSPVVPRSPLTGQDRRGNGPPSPRRGATPVPSDSSGDGTDAVVPLPPSGRRARDVKRFDEQVRAYAAARFPDLPDPDRSQAVRSAVAGHSAISGTRDGDATHETVEAYVRKWVTPTASAGTRDDRSARMSDLGAQAAASNNRASAA